MKAIIRKSLADEVAEALQHKIRSGVFAIEAKLPNEVELMKTFGVGRSTIREAVKILAQAGFVNVRQGLGTFVVSHVAADEFSDVLQQADFADIFEVRQLLEVKIVARAAINRTAEDLVKIKQHLDDRARFSEAGDFDASIKSDIAFHIQIAESCGNKIMSELYKTLSKHVEKFFNYVHKDATSFNVSQQYHEELYLCIEAKDAENAVEKAQIIIGKQ